VTACVPESARDAAYPCASECGAACRSEADASKPECSACVECQTGAAPGSGSSTGTSSSSTSTSSSSTGTSSSSTLASSLNVTLCGIATHGECRAGHTQAGANFSTGCKTMTVTESCSNPASQGTYGLKLSAGATTDSATLEYYAVENSVCTGTPQYTLPISSTCSTQDIFAVEICQQNCVITAPEPPVAPACTSACACNASDVAGVVEFLECKDDSTCREEKLALLRASNAGCSTCFLANQLNVGYVTACVPASARDAAYPCASECGAACRSEADASKPECRACVECLGADATPTGNSSSSNGTQGTLPCLDSCNADPTCDDLVEGGCAYTCTSEIKKQTKIRLNLDCALSSSQRLSPFNVMQAMLWVAVGFSTL